MTFESKTGNGYAILYPRVKTAEEFDASVFENIARQFVESGNRAVVLSLRDISKNRTVSIGVIVLCSQIVRSLDGYLVLIDSRDAEMNALEEICQFMNIPVYDNEETLCVGMDSEETLLAERS